MNFKRALKIWYARHKKKAIAIFLVYFVTKWTLTFIFGAKLLAFLKGLF